jgi:signal transduction histidine kinase
VDKKQGDWMIGAASLSWLRKTAQRVFSVFSGSENSGSVQSVDREKELERELERLQIVFRLSSALNSTLDYEHVLELALDLANSSLADPQAQSSNIKSAVLLYDGEAFRVAAARGFSQADMRAALPGDDGLLSEAFRSAGTSVGHSPSMDPELKFLAGLHMSRVAVCIPLSIGYEVYGVLLFGHRQTDFFNTERIKLLEIVAQQVMISLQNARLYRDLVQEQERIMSIQEEANKKLARDLHDGPTQSIAAIAMRVNFARRLMERDTKATAEELFKIEELARRTTKEIRQMLFTLRPLVLESQGLIPALEQLAEKFNDGYQQNVCVDIDGNIEELELNKKTVIFYIAEEAIGNACKHARAKHIWVRLRRKENDDLIAVEIVDDGIGFNLSSINESYEQSGSLGLINLRERADLVSGLLKINSTPGQGTTIHLTVPTSTEAADNLHRPGFAA